MTPDTRSPLDPGLVVTALVQLHEVLSEHRRHLGRALQSSETDVRALELLWYRTTAGLVTRTAELREHVGISSAGATLMIDRMQERGHVERRPHPDDRRQRLVVLTPDTQTRLDRLVGETYAELLATVTSVGSPNAIEIATALQRTLTRTNERIADGL